MGKVVLGIFSIAFELALEVVCSLGMIKLGALLVPAVGLSGILLAFTVGSLIILGGLSTLVTTLRLSASEESTSDKLLSGLLAPPFIIAPIVALYGTISGLMFVLGAKILGVSLMQAASLSALETLKVAAVGISTTAAGILGGILAICLLAGIVWGAVNLVSYLHYAWEDNRRSYKRQHQQDFNKRQDQQPPVTSDWGYSKESGSGRFSDKTGRGLPEAEEPPPNYERYDQHSLPAYTATTTNTNSHPSYHYPDEAANEDNNASSSLDSPRY